MWLPPTRNQARARALNQVFEGQAQIVIDNYECLAYMSIMRRQGRFEFRTWGGKRRGAGRKQVAERRQVAHRPRERVNAQHPILVTTRVMPDVARLRTKVMHACGSTRVARRLRCPTG